MRVRSGIGDIVGAEQFAFVPGRQISDAHILLRCIREQLPDIGILSVDIEKAFDSLCRKFIVQCLGRLGFGPRFINLARRIYQPSIVSILHKSRPTRAFTKSRGIHQADPLSPLVYVIAMEALHAGLAQQPGLLGASFVKANMRRRRRSTITIRSIGVL